jgi:hypothetical protein
MRFLAEFLEPRLVQSHTTVVIPFDDRVIFVRPLDCAQFPSRLSEISQALDTISGTKLLVGGRRVCKRRLLGTVCIRRCARVRQRRLGSFPQFWCQLFGDESHIPWSLSKRREQHTLLGFSILDRYSIGLERRVRLIQTAQFWQLR